MAFDDVFLVSDKLTLATDDEVTAAEAALGVALPRGYRTYVTTLGAGSLNSLFNVYLPARILAEYREVQSRWMEVWGPDDSDELVEPDDVSLSDIPPLEESIIVCDDNDANEYFVHARSPGAIFVLPHEEGVIYKAGTNLEEAFAWLQERRQDQVRVLTPAGEFHEQDLRYFMPSYKVSRIDFSKIAATYEQLRTYLTAYMQRRLPGGGVCLEYIGVDDDGSPPAWLCLYVKEFAGEVRCIPWPQAGWGLSVNIEYDAEQRTAGFQELIAYLDTLGGRRAPA